MTNEAAPEPIPFNRAEIARQIEADRQIRRQKFLAAIAQDIDARQKEFGCVLDVYTVTRQSGIQTVIDCVPQ
jgi:hypothetical protein